MTTKFRWGSTKAENNRRKHGVSFEVALRAFDDPFGLTEMDRIEEFEQRWRRIGSAGGNLLLLVAYVTWEEDDNGEEVDIIRILSARKVARNERRRYERQDG